MIIGYIRVSTIEQDLNNQRSTILDYCNSKKMIVDEFIEVKSSSRKDKKERKIDELLERVQEKDILVVTELSRIGRSVSEVLDIANALVEKKIRLICIKEGIDLEKNQSMQSKIMITMVSLFADLERDLISARTKEALAVKKAMGVKLGRPPGPGKSKLEPLRDQIQGYLDKDISMLNISRLLNVSYTTMHNFIRKNKMLKGTEKKKLLAQKQKIEKIKLHLNIDNSTKGGRGVKRAIENIKTLVLPHFDPSARNIGSNKFILKVRYKDDSELDDTINTLLNEIRENSELKNCTSQETYAESIERDALKW